MLAELVLDFQAAGWMELYGPFLVLAVIIALTILVIVRGGRNYALERSVEQSEFGSPTAFRGTLVVEESQPGAYLRLRKSTKEARRLQFWYVWIIGSGRQARFDQLIFDGARRSVEMAARNKLTNVPFSEFSAVRMRERAVRRGGGSLWHLELLRKDGRVTSFVSSAMGDRQGMFEQTASVAKVVSKLMGIPVQVFVAGNTWTPGWPPRNRATST